ncbi:RNase adapter RapZ [Jannaschia ovalis]|uniref:RNase adapter RapZ n=1 Tax=Jannaschia ovalis TaxID=3038773 RepID=A0ABY8LGB8_9RHOB|nr:RNase adapter RapZ [Jannaschia sp. GRR-S6-38]WGH79199.1 RNase adapter RapZ [Jannaschia sp. GRR-S6-38]
MTPPPDSPDLILVTGPSGAGRTTAIRALEDQGFEVIDNLPLSMVTRMVGDGLDRPLALSLDVRNRDFSVEAVADLVAELRADPGVTVRLLYLDCDADALVRRFSETRRRHPLAPSEDAELGVARELELLAPLADLADLLIDTSALNVHDLKSEMARYFGRREDRLAVSVQSFSYKRGLPRGLDMVFDVRFLRNPHWVPDLRRGTGRDAAVRDHVTGDPHFAPFYARVEELILSLLPAYRDEGRAHLAIGFGCTGGRHRSVALTEMLAESLAAAGWQVSKRHRELDRRATAVPGSGPGDMAHGGSAA